MRASLAELDQGEFTEGHELDRKWKVAKQMVGRRLSQEEEVVGEVGMRAAATPLCWRHFRTFNRAEQANKLHPFIGRWTACPVPFQQPP